MHLPLTSRDGPHQRHHGVKLLRKASVAPRRATRPTKVATGAMRVRMHDGIGGCIYRITLPPLHDARAQDGIVACQPAATVADATAFQFDSMPWRRPRMPDCHAEPGTPMRPLPRRTFRFESIRTKFSTKFSTYITILEI
jgi:hypothetical protein